jgi:hypothetical protein
MTDLEHILPMWHELEAAGADYVLATIVAVEGSSGFQFVPHRQDVFEIRH